MIKKIQNDAGVRIQFKQGEGGVPRCWCYPHLLQALSACRGLVLSSCQLFFWNQSLRLLSSVDLEGGRMLKLLTLSR